MAMNIEQRLEQSAKSIEQSSQKAHDFAEKDTTIQTCAGSRDSLPKVSRIWQENFARQMNQHATEFQDRFALSQQSLPWQAGITISDSLQRYHVGVQGEEGYKEFLPNPLKLPFETAATLAEDLTQQRWLENGVPNKHWTESKVASALEKSLGMNARIWPKDRDLQVGDVIPSAQETADGLPITHVIVDGNAYAMSPVASGSVSELTLSSAKISGITIDLYAIKKPGRYHFSQFGGKCDGVNPDDDAWDMAMRVLPRGSKLDFYGMATDVGHGLVLTRHHIHHRGEITIDFAGIDIYWRAPNGYQPDRSANVVSNPRSPGIFCFRGQFTGEEYKHTLTERLPEFSEQLPVSGISEVFKKGSWWVVSTDISPGTKVGKEINYLIQCQGDYGNPNQVRFNYRTGWDLDVGRELIYKKAIPVSNIYMLNMGLFYYEQSITDGSGSGDDFTSQQASSLVSFEIAKDYKISGIKARNQPFAVVFEQWVNNGVEENCSTEAPDLNRSDQVVGRNGALYCEAINLENKSGRHVIDHTSSAYCIVRNSRETGTKNGAYTHHGSFEHDIFFENTTGVLSIANSGPDYGESAKRIKAKNHNGTQLIADKKVSDCTFDSCLFSQFAKINADNNVFINTSVPKADPNKVGGLMFSQSSQRTGKGFTAYGGVFELAISTTAIPSSVLEDISFHGSKITDFRARRLDGFGALSFINVDAESTLRGANLLGQSKIIICGGVWKSVPFKLTGAKDQYVALDGGYKAEGAGDAIQNITWDFDKDLGGILEINIGDASFNHLGKATKHFRLSAATGTLKYKSVGATFIGGSIEFQPATDNVRYIYHRSNVEDGVQRISVPTEKSNISTLDNMII
ncbi:TPA: hypothetical protein PMB63_000042 [Vibrio cholerae]|nr:hypothetical protein [Vibrio cholerae]